jgi:hypothetical protein
MIDQREKKCLSLDGVDVAIRLLPMTEQVCLLVIVDADVLVVEHPREEVVDLHRNVENVADPGETGGNVHGGLMSTKI